MRHETFIQYNEDGEPDRIMDHKHIVSQPRVEMCVVYSIDEDVDNQRRWSNCAQTAQFASKLIGELGFRIPHPEFYPDEYKKFEKDWKAFTEHAKDHRRIMELQDRQALLLQERVDHLIGGKESFDIETWFILLDGNIEDLRKLGVYK